MPVLVDKRWSPSDLALLPDDGNRYECIDGALLVTPAPSEMHQRVVAAFHLALAHACTAVPDLVVMLSPADITLEPETLVQPDLFVLRSAGRRPVGGWKRIHSLVLAVEVLSPGSVRHDRGTKRRFYQRAPAGEYWIVDPEERCVERWRAGDERPETTTSVLMWCPVPEATALEIDLTALFAEAYGEG